MADTDPVVDPTVDDEIEEDIPEPVSGSLIKGVCVCPVILTFFFFRLQFH